MLGYFSVVTKVPGAQPTYFIDGRGFFTIQKNPGVFHRPPKIPFGQNFRPQKIPQTLPSLKYVNGTLGRKVAV